MEGVGLEMKEQNLGAGGWESQRLKKWAPDLKTKRVCEVSGLIHL